MALTRGFVIALASVACGHHRPGPDAAKPFINVAEGLDIHMRSQVPTNACLLVEGFDAKTSNVVEALQRASVRLTAGDSVAMHVVGTARKDGHSQLLLATVRDLQPFTKYTLEVEGLPPALDHLWRDATIGRFGRDALTFSTSGWRDSLPPRWKSQPNVTEARVYLHGPKTRAWTAMMMSPQVDEDTATLAFLVTLTGRTGTNSWFVPVDSRPEPGRSLWFWFGVDEYPKGERVLATVTAIDVACNRQPAPSVVPFTAP